MKKLTLLVLALLVSGAMLFAGGSEEKAAPAAKQLTQKVTYKLAHVYNPGHPWDEGAKLAAKIIREKTNGMIEVQVYPSSQLGTEEQATEAVIFGSIEMAQSGAGQIGNLFKPIYVCEMPYTFRDNNHVILFSKSDIAKQMFGDLEKEFGVKVIGTSSFGVRQLTANKTVNTPADLKGFKLRVPEQMITMEYAKAMGANPTPIAYAEAYMALQQGVVDGLENPLSAIKNMKFHEVQKVINLTSHVTNVNFFLMNGKVYNGLDGQYQKIILDAFAEASKLIVDILNEDDKKLGDFFKSQGLTVHQPDVEAFKKATADMPVKLRKWWIRYGEDLHKRIQDMK
jgi:tripartite ATP-independent transporter DctP family solute receptor